MPFDVQTAPDGSAIPVVTPANTDTQYNSARAAAQELANLRWSKNNPEPPKEEEVKETSSDSAEVQEAAPSDEAPAEEAPAEIQTEAEPEPELPPIEPPRSWTKEDKEEFATYPREAQEKIARREQERDSALRRSQNDAAEARKAIESERAKVEQARQQYEAALPALLQTLQEQQAGEFADIKTIADVEKLAREDWPRYALWDAQQKKLAAVQQEVNAAKIRQETEFKSRWSEFAAKEDQLLLDKAPELADKAQSQKVADGALNLLKDVGFNEQDLAKAWNGEEALSLRDHRLQLIILDALKYRQAKAIKPSPKPIPPVQKPGTRTARIDAGDAQLQALEKSVLANPNPRSMATLLAARRSAQARRQG